MKLSLEKEIHTHTNRLEYLSASPEENKDEIESLKQAIEAKKAELAEFDTKALEEAISMIDEQSTLPDEVKDEVKGELGIESEEKAIEKEVEEIEEEIYVKGSLQEVSNEADAIENILSELVSEKSFWGYMESIEEKVQKIEELFNGLDTTELERQDIETKARGWNVTHNIEGIKSFKQNIIECISGKNTYGWGLGQVQNFEELISQKEFQDIIWISSGIDPRIITTYHGNQKFNAFIQERPEFLESSEFKTVRLHQIREGVKNGTLFEGYIHTQSEEFPETKIDFFKKDENKWSSLILKDEEDIFDENKNKKTKRKSLGNKERPYIIDLDKYEYDISNIDSLSNEEKKEIKGLFIEKISSNMYTYYSSEKVFAEEIFKVGSKLGVSEDEINHYVYKAMIQGVVSGRPPANEIDKEFSVVYQKIQETLTEPEKRKELLDSLQGNIKTNDEHFDSWKETLIYLNVTDEEKEVVINSYLDFSQGEQFPSKQRDIFGYGWESEENFNFSKKKDFLLFQQ